MNTKCTPLAVAAGVLSLTAFVEASIFTQWNAIVRHDVSSVSEIDGSALIGGSISGTLNVSLFGPTASDGTGLAVGGNVLGTTQVNGGGNARVASAVSGTLLNNGGGSITVDTGIADEIDRAFAEAAAFGSFLSSLVPNGTVDGAGNLNATPALINGQNVAVYEIAESQLGGGQLNLNLGGADTVVLNVVSTDGSVSFEAPPNFVGGFNQANSSRIIWNLAGVSSVTVNNNFNGALLAPDADLRLLGGGMNGTVVVDSISALNAEIRRSNYTGVVPSPGGVALAGFGALALTRRRRSTVRA